MNHLRSTPFLEICMLSYITKCNYYLTNLNMLLLTSGLQWALNTCRCYYTCSNIIICNTIQISWLTSADNILLCCNTTCASNSNNTITQVVIILSLLCNLTFTEIIQHSKVAIIISNLIITYLF